MSVGPSISSNRVSANYPVGAEGLQYGFFSLPISASYDADLWGRIRKSIEAAKEQTQASAADLENVKLELQTELASYYFTIRGLGFTEAVAGRYGGGLSESLRSDQ